LRVAIVGAGAVGSLVGAGLVQAGHEVVLIDGWPAHVEAIRSNGLALIDAGTPILARPAALHIGQVQELRRAPVELAILCVKLYDTDWAAALIAPHLAPGAPLVTLQNALVEERVAAVVGWGRTIGCIGSGLHVGLREPGVVVRHRQARISNHAVFHVGEVHGRVTERARLIAELLGAVDVADVTTNLWGERWAKLTANAMASGLDALSGLGHRAMFANPLARRVMTRVAAEALAIGQAQGFEVEPVFGLPAARWCAPEGDAGAARAIASAFDAQARAVGESSRSGSAQDLAKGRPTEVPFFNGLIVERAASLAVPLNRAIAEGVAACERGAPVPGAAVLRRLLEAA
jgi:2-dehydropantoate 2-reductase